MKKRWPIVAMIVSIIFIMVAVLFFFNNRKSGSNSPEYVVVYAENQTADYPTTRGGQKFADLVYERTNGRIKIIVKYDAELGSESEAINQMKYGGIAFARVSLSQLAERIPSMNVLLMPFLYNDSDHMWRVLEGDIGDRFLLKADEYDLVGLSWYDAGARNFYSKSKPITSVEDLNGMKIRVQESSMMADMVEALGAKPVEVVYSEVYSSFEQGLVDGAENNWPSYESMKHYKVAEYYTIDEHIRVPELQVCSKVIWNTLSEEDRNIIHECALESSTYERQLWKEREESSKNIAVSNGTQVIELTPEERKKFRDAMTGVYEKYCGEYMDIVRRIMTY